MAITYILVKLIDGTPTQILGFISIKASSLLERVSGIPSGFPALEIAELAVCEKEEGQGYGTMLVEHAIGLADSLRYDTMGIRYVVLMADPMAENFYLSFRPPFQRIDTWYTIPHEHWNKKCIGMFMKLPELPIGE